MPAEQDQPTKPLQGLALMLLNAWRRSGPARAWLITALIVMATLLYMRFAMAVNYTVTSTADTSGSTCGSPCTLRQAITAANAAGVGPHNITFSISGCSTGCTISPSSDLPALTRPMTINGAGAGGVPLIRLNGGGSRDYGLRLQNGSSGSTIRGLVFSNFTQAGIHINGSSNNLIAGNYIGTDLTGNTRNNNRVGLHLASGTGNTIGGMTTADRNIFGGSDVDNLDIETNSNIVIGNSFGQGSNGSANIGGGYSGIYFHSGASNNRVGGPTANEANVIINQTRYGVEFSTTTSSGNAILRNSIFGNGDLGIDHGANGVTPNDSGDGDSGANQLQNHPILTSAVTNTVDITFVGTLNSTLSTNYRVEFFRSASADSSGNGEGQVYLGSTDVTTNGSGDASFNVKLTGVSVAVGQIISATATLNLGGGNYGSTSEFAANRTATAAPAGITVSAISGNTTEAGGAATFTVVLNRAPTANVTLPVSSDNTVEGTVAPASLTFTSANWSTPQTVTVTGQDDTLVDGNRACTIVLAAATSGDAGYNGLNAADVAVTNTDNDTLSTILVTTTSDVSDGNITSLYALLTNKGADGQISLREAITAANNTVNGSSGADRIHFSIAGAGPHTIAVLTALPTLTQPVIIDGTSEPDFTSAPIIELNGGNLGTLVKGLVLNTGSDGSTIKGLTINRYTGTGLEINGTNNHTIQGNWIGLNNTGTAASANGVHGIYAANSSGHLIGGSTAAERNVVSGNSQSGIRLDNVDNSTISGNYVGTNAAGTGDVSGPGSNTAQTGLILVNGASGNTVGGLVAGARNVLSGNNHYGLEIQDAGSQNNLVQGNYIGTDAAGAAALGNTNGGASFWGAGTGNWVGGSAAGAGNVISSNGLGVLVGNAASGATVQGNLIGLAADGVTARGNSGSGIRIEGNSINTVIGSNADGSNDAAEANTIAHNSAGVVVTGTSSTASILRNAIHNNTGIGIDLLGDGVTGNDGGDGDGGPNSLQNFPVLSSALMNMAGTQITVTGSLNSQNSTPYRIEFFASTTGDATHGEGQRYLGSVNVTTDGSGNASFNPTLTVAVAAGEAISATATQSNVGFTTFSISSEFAAHVTAALPTWPVSGTVYEDVNYGGGAGRSLATSAGAGVIGARVELYNSAGTFVTSTTTAADGSYTFSAVTAGTYYLRVASQTVQSTRTGSVSSLRGVLTWRADASSGAVLAITDFVGGTNPAVADPGSGASGTSFNTATNIFTAGLTGTAHAVAPVVVSAAAVSGVNFGFNFSTAVNTNNSGQGSLRQAMTNANTLANAGLTQSGRTAGIENLVFMISNGTTAAGLRNTINYFSGGVASIAPASALPTVTDPLVLDAQTQPGWSLAPLVELNGSGAGAGASGLTLNAASSVLRGFVVNRFAGEGVTSTAGAGLVIQGNYIGINAAGTAASPNSLSGIWIDQSAGGHQIGGNAAAQRNVISGQATYQGLAILGGSGHTVQGNYIGTNAAGTAVLGNASDGIKLYGTVSNSTIGGTAAGAGNLVRGNGGRGILVIAGASGINITGNSIHGNTSLGIDLNENGISANDGAKTVGAANQLMDHPVFTTAALSGTTLTVAGYVGSAASQTLFASARVEVFIADASSSNGQGQTYLGFVTADASGNFSGTITGVTATTGSTQITGTATDGGGNTSEFGANATIGWGITGTVFEDANYGGGVGRNLADAAGVAVSGATVELYDSSGVWIRSTTTAANGGYSFTGLAAATYHIRVVSSTVLSQRSGSTAALLGVMTYRTSASSGTAVAVTDQVGGTNPAQTDPAVASTGASFNTSTGAFSAVLSGTAQAYAPVAVSTATVQGVDFGFNFNTVVNINNAGAGSLRQVITNANTLGGDNLLAVQGRSAGVEQVIFMLANGTAQPGLRATFPSQFAAGVATLVPTAVLPTISSTLVLDAQTQPGWTQDPIVELRGHAAGAVAGLNLSGSSVTVRGLVINRYGSHGIVVSGGASHTLQGNWIGTDATGAAAAANAGAGVSVGVTSASLQLGGTTAAERNVISGNGMHGVNIYGGPSVVVQGNYVGTNAGGTAAVANGARGIWLDTAVIAGTVGGTAAGAGNLISGNASHGLVLAGGASTVQGNRIGSNEAGTAALPNLNGVYVDSGGHQIGGTSASARNLMSGNTSRGVWLNNGTSTVQGNYVGTNAAGSAALPNADGIYSKSAGNIIGGSASGAGNLVSGNSGAGVLLNSLSDAAVVKGNIIGLNAALSGAIPNGRGVDISCANGCTVGGTAGGEANVISGNSGVGVLVNAASQGNAILGNRIDNNGSIGIDLNNNGVSTNDGAKTAGAGNQLMDHPVFTSARARGNQLTVAGYVGNAAGQATFANARVEIYVSSVDGLGFGEGSTYLGSITTDASGNFSGTVTMTASYLPVGTRLTGTATDTSSNTSEFGANFSGLIVDLVVNHNGDGVDANPGDGTCQTATAGQCTLRAALQEVNALGVQASALTVAFALPGCASAGQAGCIITPTSALPASTQAVIVDAQTQAGWTVTPFVELVGSSAGAGVTGLRLQTANSTVSGLVVGGFSASGISVSADNVTVQGNVIGLQADGNTARGNGTDYTTDAGVSVSAGTGVVIGGTTAAQRNVMSGNVGPGLSISGGSVTVLGSYFGTNAAGTAALGNGNFGIHVAGTGHRIGGALAGEGNLISGNTANGTGGIYVAANNVVIQGNRIGTNAAATGFLPNGNGLTTWASGIDLRSGGGHLVGGTAAGEGNIIAGNQGHGVRLTSQTSRMLGNSIYSNLWRGIDLNADNVTANDGVTNGTQPNNGMDHPVVTGAGIASGGDSITLFGYVGTGTGQAAFAGARIEVFRAAADSSGYGQGQTYLGSLTADSSGRFSSTLPITVGAAVVGDAITATATDVAGNTSEFGPNHVSTTMAGLAPAGFNAFETDTAAGALTGVIRSKVAGTAATLAVLALDSAGTAPHNGFTGSVQLHWIDSRDDSGALSGSCRASWVDLGAAGTATFSTNNRVDVAVTPPATGTRSMRLRMSYSGPAGAVVACSTDAFAALPAQLSWLGASDADSATAGTARNLDNSAAAGGVVHQAGRPFTLRAQALSSAGAVMSAYDGTPSLSINSCVLPAGCSAGTLGGSAATASAGVYTNSTVTYSEVGAIALVLSDAGYASVDTADTALASRTINSSALTVGRFVPDSYAVTVSGNGVLATANAACMVSGSGATFLGQGFGWASVPEVMLTARNAAGATTTLWTGSLMKLTPGSGLVPTLTASAAGAAGLAASWGATTVQDQGSGQVRLLANALDRFVLELPADQVQATTTPTWEWQLGITDSSEAAVAGNPQPSATATQASVSFDQGGSFHSGRLGLSPVRGDTRTGVRMLMQLQRYTPAGWVTLTEDRGCVTVQRNHVELSNPSGVFTSSGLCAAPLAATVTTAGGRAWLNLPATPGGAPGQVSVRIAGTAASGNGCSPAATVQAVTPLSSPWLTGGTTGTGPQATAVWGLAQRDFVLRREVW